MRAKSSTAWWDMCYSIGTCAYMHMSPEIVGATDSISSVRAAFSTGIKWGPHSHSGCVTAGAPLLAVWGSGFAVLSSLAVWGLMVGSKGSV